MSLFKFVPELRSRGVKVELVAWYPWKSTDGHAMADSCGIFFINRDVQVHTAIDLSNLHDSDENGIGYESSFLFTMKIGPYDVHPPNGGPGM